MLAHFVLNNPFFIFDIFSDRESPVTRAPGATLLEKFQLQPNEAVFISRSENLNSALGGFSSRLRTIKDCDDPE